MSAKDGGPAFPVPSDLNPDGPQGGMSLRDWFAGQALAGYLANEPGIIAVLKASSSSSDANRRLAVTAYEIADAMLIERAK